MRPQEDVAKALVAEGTAKASPIFEMVELVGFNGVREHAVECPDGLYRSTRYQASLPEVAGSSKGTPLDKPD